MNTHPVGDSALLIDTHDAMVAQHLRTYILRQSLKGLRELVPAHNTLLVEFDALLFDLTSFIRLLPKFEQLKRPAAPARAHDVPVTYDGEDLKEVVRLTGLDMAEVIQRHSSATYTVAFLGFAPGFPYLTGLDPKLRVPRLKTPRTKIASGAVAIADEFSGIYPRATPAGWCILGHTDVVLFDPDREPPALLTPGDTVHFRPSA
ncbi:MAG: allophanate hydrolase subunit 1 [Gammaproteobacteria bacterium]|nr:allophanate hydrolase subunit 1 [Gammaproteobacteria bacterium]